MENRGFDRRLLTAFVAMLAGNVAIYVVALPYLSHFVGWHNVWELGLVSFIPGDLVKIGVVAAGSMMLPASFALLRGKAE